MPINAHRTRVKICCISNAQEVSLALKYGADALGFVGPMPSGPGVVEDDDAILAMTKQVPPPTATVLLTSNETAGDIVTHVLACGANTIQVVNHVSPKIYEDLRLDLPAATRILQVVHVEDEYSVELAQDYATKADSLLLDSGRPSANELGGTGRTHNWELSRAIVESVTVPVFLAGGLNAQNVGDAIRTVRPYGIDVCSGVRRGLALDEAMLSEFMTAIASR
ncbi:phosphoribosylanthranilate isomerase [Rhodobacteraceae bacterium RKSG542]|uniref:phosphoribosylanthranilate isomerase n=1 Tax=Pseudovibrio flavus TaxID=2529854 RepID=UPI0012BBDD3C|nr:phosphoribosylanthranilate isomerase [Pseudovibrio flavus]MTI17201.1 phosphoribosylanthranilate isomerase [Pseudovibrio flavus]